MAKRFSKQKWSIHACNIHLGRLSSLSVLLHVVAPLPRFSSSPRNTLGLLFLSSGAHIAWKRLDNAEGTRYIHIYIYTGRRVSKAIINERGTITRVSSQLFLSKVKGNRSPDTIKLFVLAVSTSRFHQR